MSDQRDTANGRRLAIIVNEFGELGIDRELLLGCGDESCDGEDIVELANGCICCTVADDFIPTIENLLSRKIRPDHILIETSGLALPKPLVKAFDWPAIRSKLTVDGVVAVIDGKAVAEGRFADDLDAIAQERAGTETIDHDNPLAVSEPEPPRLLIDRDPGRTENVLLPTIALYASPLTGTEFGASGQAAKGVVIVMARRFRTQERNRQDALDRLSESALPDRDRVAATLAALIPGIAAASWMVMAFINGALAQGLLARFGLAALAGAVISDRSHSAPAPGQVLEHLPAALVAARRQMGPAGVA